MASREYAPVPGNSSNTISENVFDRRKLFIGLGATIAAAAVGGTAYTIGKNSQGKSVGEKTSNEGSLGADDTDQQAVVAPEQIPAQEPLMNIDMLRAEQRIDIWNDRISPAELRASYDEALAAGNPEQFTSQFYIRVDEVLDRNGDVDLEKATQRFAENLNNLTVLGLDADSLIPYDYDVKPYGYVQDSENRYGVAAARAASGLSRAITPENSKIQATTLYGEMNEASAAVRKYFFEGALEGNPNVVPEVSYQGYRLIDTTEKSSTRVWSGYDVEIMLTAAVKDMSSENPQDIISYTGEMPVTIKMMDGVDTLVFSRQVDLHPEESTSPLRQLGRHA